MSNTKHANDDPFCSNTAQPATPTADYNPVPNPTMVTFPTSNPCVTISIVDDELDEPLEYFNVIAMVTPGDPATIPDNDAIVVIRDEDCKSKI